MRAVPDSLDPAVVRRVDARLDAVVRDERVAIPLAVESGSRAWGFPSPDSDYDCRFVYVRPVADYLDPWPRRDVVETPLDAVLDVNGWDLLKAVRLLVRGNATLLEWLRSPIVYRADDAFRATLLALAEQVVDRDALVAHDGVEPRVDLTHDAGVQGVGDGAHPGTLGARRASRRSFSARRMSRLRSSIPLLAFTPREHVRNVLSLTWGTQTYQVPEVENTDAMVGQVDTTLQANGLAEVGDLVVVVSGAPVGQPGTTNSILVHKIGDHSDTRA